MDKRSTIYEENYFIYNGKLYKSELDYEVKTDNVNCKTLTAADSTLTNATIGTLNTTNFKQDTLETSTTEYLTVKNDLNMNENNINNADSFKTKYIDYTTDEKTRASINPSIFELGGSYHRFRYSIGQYAGVLGRGYKTLIYDNRIEQWKNDDHTDIYSNYIKTETGTFNTSLVAPQITASKVLYINNSLKGEGSEINLPNAAATFLNLYTPSIKADQLTTQSIITDNIISSSTETAISVSCKSFNTQHLENNGDLVNNSTLTTKDAIITDTTNINNLTSNNTYINVIKPLDTTTTDTPSKFNNINVSYIGTIKTIEATNIKSSNNITTKSLSVNSSITIPTPTSDNQAANKKYVDDALKDYTPTIPTTIENLTISNSLNVNNIYPSSTTINSTIKLNGPVNITGKATLDYSTFTEDNQIITKSFLDNQLANYPSQSYLEGALSVINSNIETNKTNINNLSISLSQIVSTTEQYLKTVEGKYKINFTSSSSVDPKYMNIIAYLYQNTITKQYYIKIPEHTLTSLKPDNYENFDPIVDSIVLYFTNDQFNNLITYNYDYTNGYISSTGTQHLYQPRDYDYTFNYLAYIYNSTTKKQENIHRSACFYETKSDYEKYIINDNYTIHLRFEPTKYDSVNYLHFEDFIYNRVSNGSSYDRIPQSIIPSIKIPLAYKYNSVDY